jgi:hypothetical protein
LIAASSLKASSMRLGLKLVMSRFVETSHPLLIILLFIVSGDVEHAALHVDVNISISFCSAVPLLFYWGVRGYRQFSQIISPKQTTKR